MRTTVPEIGKSDEVVHGAAGEGATWAMCIGGKCVMEDRVMFAEDVGGVTGLRMFGVFDGDCGSYAAIQVADRLAGYISKQPGFGTIENMERCIIDGFAAMDADLLSDSRADRCGTTAVIAFVFPPPTTHVVLAWCGNSQAFIVGPYGQFEFISSKHVPYVPSEKERILKAGGFIHGIYDQRMSMFESSSRGQIKVSRSFGHKKFKFNTAGEPSSVMIAEPVVHIWTPRHGRPMNRRVVLASHGMLDAFSEQKFEVIDPKMPTHHDDLLEPLSTILSKMNLTARSWVELEFYRADSFRFHNMFGEYSQVRDNISAIVCKL